MIADAITDYPGEVINLAVCFVVLVLNLIFGVTLGRACMARREATGENYSFVSTAFEFWTLSWAFWLFLYIAKLGGALFGSATLLESNSLFRASLATLSDLNSVCLFFVFFALSRGAVYPRTYYKRFALIVTILVIGFDVAVYSLGSLVSDTEADLFLRPWSVAAAMFAPLVVGRGFRLRHGTNSVWLIAIAYCLVQPFAYTAVFRPADREVVSFTLSAEVEVPQAVQRFVTPVATPGPAGAVEYTIRGRVDGERASTADTKLLYRAFAPHLDLLQAIGFFLCLRLVDTVLSILAVLKLVFAATVLAQIQARPASTEPNLRWFTTQQPWTGNFVASWKTYYYLLLISSLFLLVFVVTPVYGWAVASVCAAIIMALSVIVRLVRIWQYVSRWLQREELLPSDGPDPEHHGPLAPTVRRGDMHAGDTLANRYRIMSRIGDGGTGTVYEAQDLLLIRVVAIKVLSPGVASAQDASERFQEEAKILADLHHPNICVIFDYRRAQDMSFLVMERLHGESLRTKLFGSRMGEGEAQGMMIAVARGLAAAHEKGIVHRDVTAANIFLCSDERVKILDFGLARREWPAIGPNDPTLVPRTPRGNLIGTPGYMSPEQARGQPADCSSDVFSFGCVGFEIFSGYTPFPLDNMAIYLQAVSSDEPTDLSALRGGCSEPMMTILDRCLKKSPRERFASGKELLVALEGLGAGGSSER